MSAEFVEAEGYVHMISPIVAEFTLCGDAFDLASDVEGYEQKLTFKKVVSCPQCAAVIRECAGVRTYVRRTDQ